MLPNLDYPSKQPKGYLAPCYDLFIPYNYFQASGTKAIPYCTLSELGTKDIELASKRLEYLRTNSPEIELEQKAQIDSIPSITRRISNPLKHAGILYVFQLNGMSVEQLLKIRGLADSTVYQLLGLIDKYNKLLPPEEQITIKYDFYEV